MHNDSAEDQDKSFNQKVQFGAQHVACKYLIRLADCTLSFMFLQCVVGIQDKANSSKE